MPPNIVQFFILARPWVPQHMEGIAMMNGSGLTNKKIPKIDVKPEKIRDFVTIPSDDPRRNRINIQSDVMVTSWARAQ